jgi:hypothetical protein
MVSGTWITINTMSGWVNTDSTVRNLCSNVNNHGDSVQQIKYVLSGILPGNTFVRLSRLWAINTLYYGNAFLKSNGGSILGNLIVSGNFTASGGVTFSGLSSSTGTDLVADGSGNVYLKSSSLKFKENITPLLLDSELIYKLKPVSFNWKSTKQKDFGLIAEEVYKIYPDLVNLSNDGTPTSVKYDQLSILLLMELKRMRSVYEK